MTSEQLYEPKTLDIGRNYVEKSFSFFLLFCRKKSNEVEKEQLNANQWLKIMIKMRDYFFKAGENCDIHNITNYQNTKMSQQKTIKAIEINPGLSLKEPIFKPLTQNLQSYHNQSCVVLICVKCQKWLRQQVSIRANDSYYCVGCFSEVLPQCETYSIGDERNFSLLENGWPLNHELFLLEALEEHRFGNWKQIQVYMNYFGAKYSQKQLQAHYMSIYRKSLPQNENLLKDLYKRNSVNGVKKAHHGGKNLKFSSSQMENQDSQISQNSLKFNCYNPKRKEFLIQYNEDLEKYISDLEFRDDDTPQQTELKMQLIEAYNRKLQERYQKYDFIIQHKILNEEFQQKRKQEIEANDFLKVADDMLRPTMKFCKLDQYQKLTKSLEFCLKIQGLIEGLRQIRNSNANCSLESIAVLRKPMPHRENEGRPRKRVHHNQKTKSGKNQMIAAFGLTKSQLQQLFESSKKQNEPIFYKGVTVRRFEKLD